MVFPVDDFLAYFPIFESTDNAKVVSAGKRAMMYITPDQPGMPMQKERRMYALFLMAAHLLELDDIQNNGDGSSICGTPFKATVGSVTVESTKPNQFKSENIDWWYNQTKHGRELLVYLDGQVPIGVYLNDERDSVRDLV